MEKAAWPERTSLKRRKRIGSLGRIGLGLLLVDLVAVSFLGCKGSPPKQKAEDERERFAKEYWDSLFKDDPEALTEYRRILGEFQTGKHAQAIDELKGLLQKSPEAPWAEAVQFYLAQAWTLLRQYGNAVQQLDLFLERYPKSPAVPRVLLGKGQIYLALGNERCSATPEDPVGKQYLQTAREIFLEIPKKHPDEPELEAEAAFYLAEVYESLQETAKAKETFRKAAEAYPDTLVASKALYALAGVLLGEADSEGAGRVFGEITEHYANTSLAGKAEQKLEGIRLIGSKAPPLHIKEWIGDAPPAGNGYDAKLTLLDFWAIWCPHCRRNIPKMERLLATYAKRGVSLVGITREREGAGVEQVREFIKSHAMGYPTGVDDEGKTSQELAVKSIPCVVIVGPEGRIRWHGHPENLTDKVIEVLLQSAS